MAALISRTTAASDANPSDSAHKEAGTGSGNGNDRMHGSDYEFRPFRLVTTTLEFPYSRRSAPSASLVPSNIAAAWTASGIEETVIGGVLQGRKVGDVRGASKLSRRRMWELARNLAQELATELASGLDVKATLQEKWGQELRETLDGACYGDIKSAVLLEERHVAKAVLRERALVGWVRNVGDEGWGLDRSST
jgi:tRNA-specific adenosine deaminase 1